MSIFGNRIIRANRDVDAEFGDVWLYRPYAEVVNGTAEPDLDRAFGNARCIILQPGVIIGAQRGLTSGMHQRSSSEPTLFYMARGVLVDVHKYDRFYLPDGNTNPDSERYYEVADGPRPIGFGRWRAKLIEKAIGPEIDPFVQENNEAPWND